MNVPGAALSLLPLLSVPALHAALLPRRRGQADPCASRQALLDAMTVVGLFVAFSTEALSARGWLSRGPVAAAWAVFLAAGLAVVARRRAAPRGPRVQGVPAGTARAAWGGIALLAAGTLVVALAAPPNTWDSMTYHLGRVAHWIQNRSVAFYPTHSLRQLYMSPWAEYAIAQLDLLWGGDRLANLVQWGSWAGSIVGASLVAARLGAGATGQAMAAVFAATVPMGILQASSTQTDAALALWLVALVGHALRYADTGAPLDGLLAGGALGLAVLTKPTSYFYAPPLLVWLALVAWRRHGSRLLATAAAASVVALLVNAPFYARTAALWGSPLGPGAGQFHRPPPPPGAPAPMPAGKWFPARAFKNVCLHLGTPIRPLDRAVGEALRAADSWAKTWQDVVPASYRVEASPHEDEAGAPLHLALLTVLLLAARPPGRVLALASAVLAGGLIFVSQFPWQPFNARLHLPLFVVAAAAAGVLLERSRPSWIAPSAAAILLLAALPWLLRGLPRRLIGPESVLSLPRERQYFLNGPAFEGRLREEARRVSALGCRSVGIVSRDETWEYPFWVLTGALDTGLPIRHVGVTNLSGTLPEPDAGAVDCVCDLDAGSCERATALRVERGF